MAKRAMSGTSDNDSVDLSTMEHLLYGYGGVAGGHLRFDGFEYRAGAGNDKITGSSLNDILHGEGGNDRLDGGAGIDTVSYEGQYGFVNASLATGIGKVSVHNVLHQQDTFLNIENLTAGGHGSILTGNGSANVLTGGLKIDTLIGGAGNDTLIGNGGSDILEGGADIDTLTGGEGTDRFVFGADALTASLVPQGVLRAGPDTITDFGGGATQPEIIDLRGLMDTSNYNSTNFALAKALGYIKLMEVVANDGGTNTIVFFDSDGSVGASVATPVISLEHVAASSLGSANFLL